jgi:4-hydroxy-tetrahydrodipicolinate synthase
MNTFHGGVYAASLTPLYPDFSPALGDLTRLLDFLAGRGCHGALLLGTTGEGTSFAPDERRAIFHAALDVRQAHPDFRLLAGSGTPSLEETIQITRTAFDLGFDGVVVLPPYYYKKITDDGLFAWYDQVIRRAVPAGGALFGYHFPGVSGVGLSLELLSRLKEAHAERFTGIKDSSGEPAHAAALGQRFGKDLLVLTGSDRLFSQALQNQAGGCITAMANLYSPDLRMAWEAFQAGDQAALQEAQDRLSAKREVLDRYPPAPPLCKAVIARQHGLPEWTVRPPLMPMLPELAERAAEELFQAG